MGNLAARLQLFASRPYAVAMEGQGNDTSGAKALLRFSAVALERGGRMLFERMDLELGPGEGLHVAGPNGSGKSSLIRLAAGLLRGVGGAGRPAGGGAGRRYSRARS